MVNEKNKQDLEAIYTKLDQIMKILQAEGIGESFNNCINSKTFRGEFKYTVMETLLGYDAKSAPESNMISIERTIRVPEVKKDAKGSPIIKPEIRDVITGKIISDASVEYVTDEYGDIVYGLTTTLDSVQIPKEIYREAEKLLYNSFTESQQVIFQNRIASNPEKEAALEALISTETTSADASNIEEVAYDGAEGIKEVAEEVTEVVSEAAKFIKEEVSSTYDLSVENNNNNAASQTSTPATPKAPKVTGFVKRDKAEVKDQADTATKVKTPKVAGFVKRDKAEVKNQADTATKVETPKVAGFVKRDKAEVKNQADTATKVETPKVAGFVKRGKAEVKNQADTATKVETPKVTGFVKRAKAEVKDQADTAAKTVETPKVTGFVKRAKTEVKDQADTAAKTVETPKVTGFVKRAKAEVKDQADTAAKTVETPKVTGFVKRAKTEVKDQADTAAKTVETPKVTGFVKRDTTEVKHHPDTATKVEVKNHPDTSTKPGEVPKTKVPGFVKRDTTEVKNHPDTSTKVDSKVETLKANDSLSSEGGFFEYLKNAWNYFTNGAHKVKSDIKNDISDAAHKVKSDVKNDISETAGKVREELKQGAYDVKEKAAKTVNNAKDTVKETATKAADEVKEELKEMAGAANYTMQDVYNNIPHHTDKLGYDGYHASDIGLQLLAMSGSSAKHGFNFLTKGALTVSIGGHIYDDIKDVYSAYSKGEGVTLALSNLGKDVAIGAAELTMHAISVNYPVVAVPLAVAGLGTIAYNLYDQYQTYHPTHQEVETTGNTNTFPVTEAV